MNKSLLIYIVALIALLLIPGCKSTKDAGSSQRLIALQKVEKQERIEAIQYHSLHYNSLSAPLSATITLDGKNNTADGQLRIKKGEAIQLSLRMPIIGSELFRLLITPEQLVIIDRYNKQYMAESIAELKGEYPFDFDYHDIEALFANRLFITGNRDVTEHHSYIDLREDDYNIFMAFEDDLGINYNFLSNYTHRVLETSMTKPGTPFALNWMYYDFKQASNRQLFPMREEVMITNGDDEIRLSLNFKSVDVDTGFNIDNKLPTKYTKVSIKEFAQIIESL